ncbi:fibronectin type III domain-containing protein [Cohnella cellulosilytica]|uniref:Fibronectin type III domain-containing protein n=1 Tax=Cohnella cellulosilytica TaxID=986710 RepID=A0ABW2F7C2_9BACL
MKKFSLAFLSVIVLISTFFASISFAATVGQPLTEPEPGWQRYDNTSPGINYGGSGTWVTTSSALPYYKSTQHSNATKGAEFSFAFIGTKFRIIDATFTNRSTAIELFIDGVSQGLISERLTSQEQYMTLIFEKIYLVPGRHHVKLVQTLTTASNTFLSLDAIDLDDTGYLIGITNLSAIPGDSSVILNWDHVAGATSYEILRSTSAGGPYTNIGTASLNNFTDNSVENGTAYYYIATTENSLGGVISTEEASATPITPPNPSRALLTIYISGGQIKEYDLSAAELNAYLNWYDAKDAGSGPAKYAFTKTWNKGPFKTRTEYIIFDKILTFEVDEYEVENP